MTANNAHTEQGFVDTVAAGQQLADASLLAFRDPDSFRAGSLHNHVEAWEHIADIVPYEQSSLVLDWIRNSCLPSFDLLKDSIKVNHTTLKYPLRWFFKIQFRVSLMFVLSLIRYLSD